MCAREESWVPGYATGIYRGTAHILRLPFETACLMAVPALGRILVAVLLSSRHHIL